LLRFLSLRLRVAALVGLVVTDGATRGSAESTMTGKMTGNAAYDGALDAALGTGRVVMARSESPTPLDTHSALVAWTVHTGGMLPTEPAVETVTPFMNHIDVLPPVVSRHNRSLMPSPL
jgi:hypothetical protein